MKLRQTLGWLTLALVISLPASADVLDINLSGDAAKISFIRPLPPEGLEAGAGLLHHDDDGDILEADLHLVDRRSRAAMHWSWVLAASCRWSVMMSATLTARRLPLAASCVGRCPITIVPRWQATSTTPLQPPP